MRKQILSLGHLNAFKWTVFTLSCLPILISLSDIIYANLGANPIEILIQRTGEYALIFLLLTLSVSPLRKLLGIHELISIRRMLGLFCYCYACLHFSIYLVLEQWLDWSEIYQDIIKRPFITIGVINLLLLTPLAITSTDAMRARLQSTWVRLHKLIYLIAILAIIHFWWSAKADLLAPMIYASILSLLLAYRLYSRMQQRQTWKSSHN